jgi:hypothetical protein
VNTLVRPDNDIRVVCELSRILWDRVRNILKECNGMFLTLS